MNLPRWVPRWLVKLLDILSGSESVAALRCEICGHIIDIEDWITEDGAALLFENHMRHAHPDQPYRILED